MPGFDLALTLARRGFVTPPSIGPPKAVSISIPADSPDVYEYDIANRLTEVNEVPYTWDANGNLLDDGVNEYTYDSANRLSTMSNGEDEYSFTYNGQGDRLQQTVNTNTTSYTLDLNAGLTQVLGDGTTSYVYGLGRVSQWRWGVGENTPEFFLTDALGSVRQLTHESSSVVASRACYELTGHRPSVGQSS